MSDRPPFDKPPAGVPVQRRPAKGRGALSQLQHRFSTDQREPFDDGWAAEPAEPGSVDEPPPLRTQVTLESARSILGSNDSPDIYFDRSINPYRGCEHGCIYCYARPTHSYLNLSPGLDFETKLFAKRNAAELLRHELARPGYVPSMINIGSATDCYQPVERELKLTRALIEVLLEARHPFSLVTKSATVERDLDLLAEAARLRLVAVYVTITTLDNALARRLEPRAAAPQRRLRTIAALHAAGVPVGVSTAPVIPFLNEDFEQVLQAAQAAGARNAFYTVLRLPWELSALFREWLQQHYPQRAERVMARIAEMRGGKDYDSNFATRMKGSGPWAALIAQRFDKACRRLGLNRERTVLDLTQFRAHAALGQKDLF